jgi:phosphohistidine phosphatase
MNRELWLMRHGKAERYDGIEDYDRPLKKRGKRSARLIGEWLASSKLLPDLVISSPARRAIGTAKIVCDALGIDQKMIHLDQRAYDEGLVRLRSILADCAPDFQRVLLVGHNPELEDLLDYLVSSALIPASNKLLPTAALARLVLPEDWSQLAKGCADLLSITHPKKLADNASDLAD